MDNPEYTFQILEVFSKVKSKEIPHELEEYISYVARTGDPVFQWSLVKVLMKEKLQAVLNDFIENGGPIDIPPCPNVDVFNYDVMKEHLIKHLDSFMYPPFTIQRICELLAAPRKEYSRVDKYMRAIEKNVLVVSSSDLSMKRSLDADGNDSVINGILYDKVNDSLNSFSNHVFAAAAVDEPEDELSVGTKLDETDAVQQIIDESWSEEGNEDEFKLNGSSNVSFESELQQFVTEKSDAATSVADDKDTIVNVESCKENLVVDSSSPSSSTSFDNSSTVDADAADTVTLSQESSLQNIVAESASISFESVSVPSVSTKLDDDFSDTPTTSLKNEDADELKDASLESSYVETNTSDQIDGELLPAPSGESTVVDSSDDVNISDDVAEPTIKSSTDDEVEVKDDQEQEFVDCQTTVAEQSESSPTSETTASVASVPSSDDFSMTSVDEPMLECVDDEPQQTNSTLADVSSPVENTFQLVEDTRCEESNPKPAVEANDDPKESMDEKTFSAGDNSENNIEKSVES